MREKGALVLVVEDERPIRHFVRSALEGEGYRVLEADTGRQGLAEAARLKPQLVILDLGLPDMDGVEVIERLRAWSSVPVLILSARATEGQKIQALDAGADDYLTKPFGVGELLARLRVALRHGDAAAKEEQVTLFTVEGLSVDLLHRRVTVGGNDVHLTPIEYRLLAVLARNAGKVLTHQLLLKEVWGPGHASRSHYLHIYMGQLRHKLERDPARPRYLLTEVGIGYRLAAE